MALAVAEELGFSEAEVEWTVVPFNSSYPPCPKKVRLRQPRALLLDEITSALDPELVSEVLELVRELKAQGMTMLIATHEMSFERGEPARLRADPGQPETQRFLSRLLGYGGRR